MKKHWIKTITLSNSRFVFLFLFLIPCIQLYSQDSIATITKTKYKLGPAFDYDQRFSFISKKPVNIWGSRFGIFINDKFKIGIGGYFLKDHLKNQTIAQGGSQLFDEHRSLIFGTFYFEPFIFRLKLWELSVPIEGGYGKSKFQYFSNTTEILVNTDRKTFIPIGAALSLSFKCPPLRKFKPLRWFGINGMIGYRYCVFDDIFKADYDGMFWCVSGTIFVDRITDDCREHKEKKLGSKRNNSFN